MVLNGEEILTQAAKKEIGNLKKHIENGCLCNFQFHVDQTKMKHTAQES